MLLLLLLVIRIPKSELIFIVDYYYVSGTVIGALIILLQFAIVVTIIDHCCDVLELKTYNMVKISTAALATNRTDK